MNTNINVKVCPACSTNYETIYYQRRAADEPPDKVSYCSNCPVDTRRLKLDVEYESRTTRQDTNTKVSIRRRQTSSIDEYNGRTKNNKGITNLALVGYRTCIRVQGMAALRCYKESVKNNTSFDPIVATVVPVQIEKIKRLIEVHLNSVVKSEGHTVIKTNRVAPFISVEQLLVYSQKSTLTSCSNDLVIGYECKLNEFNLAEFTVLRTLQDGKQPYLLIYLPIESSSNNDIINDDYLAIVQKILAKYGTERTIKSFVNSQLISTLFIHSAKAFDWPSAPDQGYIYTWKPDGERFWYLRYGSVWIFSRRLLSGRITGWTMATSLMEVNRVGPVLDVEVMVGHSPILIDMLVLDCGKPTPAIRSLDFVLETFRHSKNIDVPIHVRNYFRSQQQLLSTRDSVPYPIDGVVGIQDGSTTIIKLKDTKSIELKLKDKGELVSAEDKIVAESTLHYTYPVNSIIEIRFTKQSTMDVPSITDTILRTDKTKANSYEVCKEILGTISTMPDTLSRRNAVQWCSSIRQKINQIASRATGKGRVILDIGAGDGQAVSDYAIDPNITYLLLEPDIVKCNKLMRRLKEPGKGESRLFEGAGQITKAIGLVANRNLKYAVVCSTMGSVLNQQYCIRTLKSSVRYCIASFSISHTVSDLRKLALNGIDVIGCGYMYDDIDQKGVLIDESGVCMQVIDNSRAAVRWGGDKVYEEQAIKLQDFKDVFNIRLAKSLVPVFSSDSSSLLNTISSKVYIVSTKKHI